MNADDINTLFDAGFKISGIGAGGFYWWLMRRLADKIDKVDTKLADHRLYTEQTFSTKEDAKTARAETNTLLTEMRKDVSDIKNMLIERFTK